MALAGGRGRLSSKPRVDKNIGTVHPHIMETSINEAFFVEGAKVAWKKGVEERYEIAKTDGVLQTREGPRKYKSGYYILTGPEGEQYSMPPTTFRKLKDDQGGSKAVPKKIPKLVKLAERDGRVHTSWGEVLEFRTKKRLYRPSWQRRLWDC